MNKLALFIEKYQKEQNNIIQKIDSLTPKY